MEEEKKGKPLRQIHAEYFAAWIPWEVNSETLLEHIRYLTKSTKKSEFL